MTQRTHTHDMDDLTFMYTHSTLKSLHSTTTLVPVSSTSYSSGSGPSDVDIRLFYHNIENIISIFPVFLVIAGTLGNIIALYVLTRKKLRTQSTMIYFASLTVMDTLSLYQWLAFTFFFLLDLYKMRLIQKETECLESNFIFL